MAIELSHTMESSNWPELMQTHRAWLSSVIYARVRNSDAVEEVLQETALAASKQSQLEHDNNGVIRWLYRVAVRQAILHLRKQSRARQRTQIAMERNDASRNEKILTENPLRILIATENRELVHRAMESLSAKDREVLMLKYYAGWTCNDAGLRLGVSPSAIKSRLLRARRNLRAELLKLDENW